MESAELQTLAAAEDRHWWYMERRALLRWEVRRLPPLAVRWTLAPPAAIFAGQRPRRCSAAAQRGSDGSYRDRASPSR
jgi:hypothetical protein